MSASWFLGVDVLDLDFGVQIDSIEQPIKSNYVGPGNMSHCRTPSLKIILITASLSSNTYNKASWRADWTFEGTDSMSCITLILFWDLWCLSSPFTGFPVRSEIREQFPRTETIRSHSSRAGKPSNLSPVSREMISDTVELCETEVCFLHIQLIGTNVWLPKTQNSPSLHCLAVFPHMAILFVFTCMMNVRDQTRSSFVTSFGPLCDWSCKFVHWPWNIRSSNTCQVQAFQNNLRAYLWQISNRFQFFFEVVVIDAGSRYFVELSSSSCLLSLHTFLRMTLHVVGPRRDTQIFRAR